MKHIIATCLLLFFLQFSWGAENYYTNSITGSDIIIGDSLELSDPQYYLHQNGLAKYKSLTTRIFLEVREEDRILLDSNWSASISLKISYIDTTGNATTNVPVSLVVDYKTGIEAYQRKDIFQIRNAHYAKLIIEGISDTSLLRFLRLGIEIAVERFYDLDPSYPVSNLSHSYFSSSNELRIAWSPILRAEYYEVSWLCLDNYYANGGSIPEGQLQTSFRNNATRILTKEEQYKIPLIYDRGYIVYRVRPIGLSGAEFKHQIRGKWTLPNHNAAFQLSATSHKYKIVEGHDVALNYRHRTSYDDEGKRTDGLIYLDGCLRGPQAP